jgi:hypothetical protein
MILQDLTIVVLGNGSVAFVGTTRQALLPVRGQPSSMFCGRVELYLLRMKAPLARDADTMKSDRAQKT